MYFCNRDLSDIELDLEQFVVKSVVLSGEVATVVSIMSWRTPNDRP
jgi:hypothetical protein